MSLSEFKQDYGYNICIKTVRKYIRKCGIRNYAAVSKPFLMPRHILNRKRWASMHKNWSVDKWATVAFSDELHLLLSLQHYVKEFGGSKESDTKLLIWFPLLSLGINLYLCGLRFQHVDLLH